VTKGSKTGTGYGRPPKEHRFRPGESGNPRGRPRKKKDVVEINLTGFLDEAYAATAGEAAQGMGAYEAEMRQTLKRALTEKDVKAVIYLLKEMVKQGVVTGEELPDDGARIELPKHLPHDVAVAALDKYGPPPWPPAKLRPLIREYLETRAPEQKIFDDIVGYDLDV
jgi:hypothetical protein